MDIIYSSGWGSVKYTKECYFGMRELLRELKVISCFASIQIK